MIRIDSSRFGKLEVPEDRLLHFPRGLFGFEDKHRFFLMEQQGTEGRLRWLQSCDDGQLAFLVTAPHFFWPEYRPTFPEGDLEALGLSKAEDSIMLTILTVPGNLKDATANLRAPLVLNEERRQGAQLICLEDYSTRQPIWVKAAPSKEDGHAGAHAAGG